MHAHTSILILQSELRTDAAGVKYYIWMIQTRRVTSDAARIEGRKGLVEE